MPSTFNKKKKKKKKEKRVHPPMGSMSTDKRCRVDKVIAVMYLVPDTVGHLYRVDIALRKSDTTHSARVSFPGAVLFFVTPVIDHGLLEYYRPVGASLCR